jgi:hypothetical protein
MKKILLINLLLLFSMASLIFAQNPITDKNSTILTITGSYQNLSGDLFEDVESNRIKTITISPAADVFIIKNLFIGGGIDYSYTEQGNVSYSSTAFGPNLGFAFGSNEAVWYPYVVSKFRYTVVDDNQPQAQKGTDIILGHGFLIPVKDRLGVNIEFNYHFLRLKRKNENSYTKGNTFNINIGILALLF